MPGLVGYSLSNCSKNSGSLDSMICAMGNFAVDKFCGLSLHIARVHPNIFNKDAQPAWNENRTLGIMFYGKIYGYEQEAEKLRNLGHSIRNVGSDAEFIIHAYEEFGRDVFTKLNGSYAFVIFDENEKKLVLVSDRFGTRPLYYAIRNGNLIFASAIRAIFKYPYPRIVNEKTMVKFFRYGRLGILGDDTWFKGIRVLPSASFLEFHDKKMQLKKYWELAYAADHGKSEEYFVEELTNRFRKAVNTRISDEVKTGVLLSGGLDSRSICTAIDKADLNEIHVYTFGIRNCDEIKIAKKVTSILGFKNHTMIELTPDELTKYAEEVVYLTDGLDIVDVSFIPDVYRRVQENGTKVYLQGFALDATLGGSLLEKGSVSARNINDLIFALDKRYTLFSSSEVRALLKDKFRHMIKDVNDEFVTAVKNAKGETLPDKSDYFTLNTRVCRFVTAGGMMIREFVEESLPTIDNELIDVITKIPPEYRYGHRLYRKFLSRLDPALARVTYVKTMVPATAPDIFWKIGMLYLKFMHLFRRGLWKFSHGRVFLPNKHDYIDMTEVWRTSPAWRKLLSETLLNDESLCYKLGYLNKEYVKTIVKERYWGLKGTSEKIAFLVTFELLLRMYFT